MINEKAMELGKKRSVIREIFEYAKARSAEIGKENVFDFSIGNPSVPAPDCVNEEIKNIVNEMPSVLLHGYTSAQGDASVRKTIADYINRRFDCGMTPDLLYMTVGAAASLTISLKAICLEGDEVVTFAPYFTEYKVFAENAGAKLVVVDSDPVSFQPDFEKLEKAFTEKTKAILINSPNNPSGAVYGEETIVRLANTLKKYSEKFGHTVYLIADEPYRELVYDKDTVVPYVMNYYDESIVCYSYSKALSLPGERIGYIAVCPKADRVGDLYAAVCGAGRSLGFVCAPALFQYLVARCVDKTADIGVYKENRDTLLSALTKYGYRCVKPDGAFYLFVQAMEEDAYAFCERAKKYELLFVPGDDFGCKGWVRIAYCVSPDMIRRALPSFEKLAKEYRK